MSRRRRPCRSSISGPCSLPPSTVPKPPSASHASRWAWVVGLVVTLALLTWALHDIDPRELVGYLRRADPLLLLAAVALATLTFPWRTLLRRATHAVLPERIAARLTRIAEGLIAGLEVLKSPARFSGVLAWSLLQWLVNAAAFAVCFRAFGLAVPPEGALLLQGIIGFGVALPASPGFVGVFEAATRVTLAIYGIDATRAVSYALAYHVSTFVPITLLGLYSLSRLQLHLAELRTAGDAPAQTGGSVDHVKHTPR